MMVQFVSTTFRVFAWHAMNTKLPGRDLAHREGMRTLQVVLVYGEQRHTFDGGEELVFQEISIQEVSLDLPARASQLEDLCIVCV